MSNGNINVNIVYVDQLLPNAVYFKMNYIFLFRFSLIRFCNTVKLTPFSSFIRAQEETKRMEIFLSAGSKFITIFKNHFA